MRSVGRMRSVPRITTYAMQTDEVELEGVSTPGRSSSAEREAPAAAAGSGGNGEDGEVSNYEPSCTVQRVSGNL